MFFKKLFSKDYSQLKAKADALFGSEHFSDARLTYQEAMEKVGSVPDKEIESAYLASRISAAGNKLAEMNISEAEAAIRCGDVKKGHEYLNLSLELADDVTIREKAEILLSLDHANAANRHHEHAGAKGHSCGGCSSHSSTGGIELPSEFPDQMHSNERFHLLINTLPGDLPKRYEALGEKFARAYLLGHADDMVAARQIYGELLSENENDILLCETALLEYRLGDKWRCESLLKRAITLNDKNPLCYLSLVQLYIDARRFNDAIPILSTMLQRQFLYDQALIMLGDVHSMSGNTESAIGTYSNCLQIPTLKKAAAERLVQLLGSLGRSDEAAFIAKNYLKGCC